MQSDPPNGARRRAVAAVLAVAVLLLLGFGVRLALGIRTQVDGDEATLGLAAIHINHGSFVLMDPSGQYLGALDAYIAAPFIAVMGASALAIRLALAVTGALYVLCMYGLGRVLYKNH